MTLRNAARRCAPLLSLIAVASLRAQPPVTGTLVTANMNASTASIIDVASGATIATLPTGAGPHEVAISHDGRWAVISIYGARGAPGNSLLVIDLPTASVARTIDLGDYKRPHGMRFLPGDARLLVTSELTQKVIVVDFARGTVDTTVPTGQATTHMVALTADGRRAFTSNISAGTVSELDLRGFTIARTFTIGSHVEGIAVTPSGSEVWLGGNESKQLYVLDTKSGAVTTPLGAFGFPYRIGITPDGKSAVISDAGAERILIADVAQHRIRHTIDVPRLRTFTDAAAGVSDTTGSSPQGVTIAADGKTAFVTLKAAARVAIVDIASGALVRTVAAGGGSDGVGYSPLVIARGAVRP